MMLRWASLVLHWETSKNQSRITQGNTEANPREHLKAISLHSGKTIEARTAKDPSAEIDKAAVYELPCALQEPIE